MTHRLIFFGDHMDKWIKKAVLTFIIVYSNLCLCETQRDSVSKEEVNGTFVMKFPKPYAGISNTLTVRALGREKIKISFNLSYPYKIQGELQANTGELSGIASIKGDTAVYHSSEYGQCTITIKFIKMGTVAVNQEGSDADCGFGHNFYADGTYIKQK